MMFKTHLALGFLIATISLNFLDVNHKLIFVVLITIFSSLPDIDHPKSKIGRNLFFISWPINLIFKHRGFFHSIFPPLIIFLFFNYLGLSFLAFAVSIGYLSHLIGDTITKEGINFLYPLTKFKIQGPISTGGFLEMILFIIIMLINVVYTLKIIIF